MSALQIISHPIHSISERSGRNQEVEAWSFWQEVDRLVSAKIRESVHIEEGINYDKSSKKYQCVIENMRAMKGHL